MYTNLHITNISPSLSYWSLQKKLDKVPSTTTYTIYTNTSCSVLCTSYPTLKLYVLTRSLPCFNYKIDIL